MGIFWLNLSLANDFLKRPRAWFHTYLLLCGSGAKDRLSRALGEALESSSGSAPALFLAVQHLCLFSWLWLGDPFLLRSKSNSTENTEVSGHIIFPFVVSIKVGSTCYYLPLAQVPWSIFPFCLEVAESSLTRWWGIGLYGGRILCCCELQLRRLSFSSALTQKIKHKHIFYSSSVLILDGRKHRLVIKIRGSVIAFAAMSSKFFSLSLH